MKGTTENYQKISFPRRILMQEEVENRTVNLAVSTTRLTARSIIRGVRWFIMSHNQKKIRKQMKHPFAEGKQSVADLLKAGVSTDKIELPDGSARDFCKRRKERTEGR